MNVLVVDDDIQMRLVLKHILAREGCTVAEAEDGNIALKKMSVQNFSLVLIDMIMPNKEGTETILEMRRAFPDLKIIAMSGDTIFQTFDPLKLAKDCGADFIIAKPFQPSALRNLIRLCLPGTSA